MSRQRAINKANRIAKRTGETLFVVWDIEYDTHAWQVTDQEGLETFHAGIHESNIAYCTDDGEGQA